MIGCGHHEPPSTPRRPAASTERSSPANRVRASPQTPAYPARSARRAAFDVLRAVSDRDAYANLALPAILAERGITGRDAAFATELTYGACRTRGLLDAVIGSAAGRPVDQIDPVLRDLLRLGTYQLRTNVAEHAAVSTTVEQAGIEFDSARRVSSTGAARHRRPKRGLLGGRTRAVRRRGPGWSPRIRPRPPRWIAQAFADALGADAGELDAALAADDARPPCTSRPVREL